MKLVKFRVTNFRSVEDSGWIEAESITSLIGINESGKSNLLLPLWKLNPAEGGAISPLSDFPRAKYNDFRAMDKKPKFIEAHFELPINLAKEISEIANCPVEGVGVVSVSKDLGNNLFVNFPANNTPRDTNYSFIEDILVHYRGEIAELGAAVKLEVTLKESILEKLDELVSVGKNQTLISIEECAAISSALSVLIPDKPSPKSKIVPKLNQAISKIDRLKNILSKEPPESYPEIRTLIADRLPKFVYYSNYGNLDSEIYLPHVIQNLTRNDLGSKEEAKARTLKVLFDFVRLSPNEILELGSEGANLNSTQLEDVSEKKRERDILLQSASSKLTKEFRDWWQQGDYRFRFAADGNHFRIWVSDDLRPDDVELEGRSTGLQWFLSFFLVFLVEAKDSHSNAILLLDEPGVTLHPLAQRDLSRFFENLSRENQLIYSTHSPFMLDTDKMDRVRAVYLDSQGKTCASSDLRSSAPDAIREKSIFAAHAALGLSVSDVLLHGSDPVIVEGVSDQIYMSGIKNLLVASGRIVPKKELVFVPSGGTKGIKAIASIVSTKEDDLPMVIVDSDKNGTEFSKKLKRDLYLGQEDRILEIRQIVGFEGSEVEDLIPLEVIAKSFSFLFRNVEEDIEDFLVEGKPVVEQIEGFAKARGLNLHPGWKVDLARAVRGKLTGIKNFNKIANKEYEKMERLLTLLAGREIPETIEQIL